MKNPDLIAGLLTLLALLVAGGIYAFTDKTVLSTDLMAALGAFVMAALTRWRLSLKPKAEEAPEPSSPVSEVLPSDTPTDPAVLPADPE